VSKFNKNNTVEQLELHVVLYCTSKTRTITTGLASAATALTLMTATTTSTNTSQLGWFLKR